MKIDAWLKWAERLLEQAGIGTARLDVLVLLEDVTGLDRARLLAEPEREISKVDVVKLEKLLKQRAKHVPLAYVRGKTEFYGHEFLITPAVLEPRPESETMIDLLKILPFSKVKPWKMRVGDVGCGCGALGISAKLELPEALVELLEIDPKALEVAQKNVVKFTADVTVRRSDLLADTASDYDVLLCNLPYVPDDYVINRAAMHEPRLAIFGGPDGLDLYRRLFAQAQASSKQPLYILTEALPPQHSALETIAAACGYRLHAHEDFIQVFKLASK